MHSNQINGSMCLTQTNMEAKPIYSIINEAFLEKLILIS